MLPECRNGYIVRARNAKEFWFEASKRKNAKSPKKPKEIIK